jgi:glycerol-3-phosphate O-acyltransferase
MTWLRKIFLLAIQHPTRWLVKTKCIPADISKELGIDINKPIIYLLRTESATDQVALSIATQQVNMPKPLQEIGVEGLNQKNCVFLERPQTLVKKINKSTDVLNTFATLFQKHREQPELDLQIVPVSVFWGRAPGKSKPGWTDLLANRASPSWLRKFFIVLFLGRDNFVVFSKSVSSRAMFDTHGTDNQLAQKLIRVARTHFHRKRLSFAGPRMLEKQQMFNGVLGSEAVKKAVLEESQSKKLSQEQARQQARKYIEEIAADYREGLIRLADRLLTKLWNKIYAGIKVNHADKVRDLAANGHEIIYVPCHRSHMDYLLLTYAIYHEGLVTPHIAAGINLNFWPIGGVFRRAGAFFLRRSFAGNKLYTAVFREYLEQLFNKGYSVKYYLEGGRSRTGRLLPPKTGMLAMTLQSMIKGINRPVSLVPVYIGYEHVMEVNSYLKELKGKDKQKESFFNIFSAIKKLRNYGTGFLNFGEPISLNQFLDKEVADWREMIEPEQDKKPVWLTPAVNSLASHIMCRINQAAALSGMALVSTCVLASKRKAMSEHELTTALEHCLLLFKDTPYSELVTLPEGEPEDILNNTLKLDKFDIHEDSFGRIISLDSKATIAQTYYRNNVLHLFTIPALIAAGVLANGGMEKSQLLQLVSRLYPLLQKELFMYMTAEQCQTYAEETLQRMKSIGLLVQKGRKICAPEYTDKAFYSLWLINRTIQETLQRYALVLTLLDKEHQIQRGVLEKQSRLFAERLSSLHGISAPEFYDKNVLSTFINALKDNALIDASDQGLLMHSEQTSELQQWVISLISPDIAQSIERIQIKQ